MTPLLGLICCDDLKETKKDTDQKPHSLKDASLQLPKKKAQYTLQTFTESLVLTGYCIYY